MCMYVCICVSVCVCMGVCVCVCVKLELSVKRRDQMIVRTELTKEILLVVEERKRERERVER